MRLNRASTDDPLKYHTLLLLLRRSILVLPMLLRSLENWSWHTPKRITEEAAAAADSSQQQQQHKHASFTDRRCLPRPLKTS